MAFARRHLGAKVEVVSITTTKKEKALCTGAIAHKQGNAKIGFQSLYACAHCRLGNMQSIGLFQKAVIGDYAQKSSNLINVYRLISDMPILMSKKYRLSYMTISFLINKYIDIAWKLITEVGINSISVIVLNRSATMRSFLIFSLSWSAPSWFYV